MESSYARKRGRFPRLKKNSGIHKVGVERVNGGSRAARKNLKYLRHSWAESRDPRLFSHVTLLRLCLPSYTPHETKAEREREEKLRQIGKIAELKKEGKNGKEGGAAV